MGAPGKSPRRERVTLCVGQDRAGPGTGSSGATRAAKRAPGGTARPSAVSLPKWERKERRRPRSQTHEPRTLWLTLVNGVLSVMVSKGDLAPLPSVGVATSQLNCMADWLMPASAQRCSVTENCGKRGSHGVTQTSG